MKKNKQYSLEYWKQYNAQGVTMHPSNFARFCLPYINKGESLLDVCCGNGRDSKYFTEQGLNVVSFDYETVNLLEKVPKFGTTCEFDNVYCRFVFHAVPEHLEDYILINSHKVLKTGGLLFIETRSDSGKIEKKIDTHYRRLINLDELKNKLRRINFELVYVEEAKGLSVYNDEDPVLIRIVARKQGEIVTRGTRAEEKQTYNAIHPVFSVYLLLVVKQILDFYEIPFFLIFGTLLGAYREKDFIKHDSDVDIGLLEQYNEKIMELINDGYFAMYGLKYTREWHEKTHIRAFQYKNDYIDLWFFKKKENQYRSGRRYFMSAQQIDRGFSKILFYGQKYNAPNDIESYLRRHYSNSDWQVPVEDYHAKF